MYLLILIKYTVMLLKCICISSEDTFYDLENAVLDF
jgi:hypothetical protein